VVNLKRREVVNLGGISRKIMKMDMKPKENEKRLFDRYIEAVKQRQRFETEYYMAENKALLPEIELARKRIRQVMRVIDIKI
jgi:hypothetical protein